MTRTAVFFIALTGAFVAAGCGSGDSGPETVAVSGRVLLDGEPLEGAEVTFVTDDFASFGKTDADGYYELVQGGVPGENKVRLSKWDGEELVEFDAEDGFDEGQIEAALSAVEGEDDLGPDAPRQLIPEDFRELKYVVPEGGTDSADFRLRSR